MKFSSKGRQQGSVLVVTLFSGLVIATMLASYLVLISNRYTMTVRSMDWNAAMPVLEAGIEEALAHLHYDTNNPCDNDWTARTVEGQPVITKRRDFPDGSYANILIRNFTATNPVIYSSGFMPAPLGQGYIERTVSVTTERPKAFLAAIAANGQVTLSGGAIVDSYNSCLGAYSATNSLGTNGSIATNYRATSAIKLGPAHVYGTVTTGPGGTVSYGTGAAGDAIWNANQSGVQPGWQDDSMNVAFPTNSPPYLPPGAGPPPVIIAGGSNITSLASGTYRMPSFTSLDKTKPMIVSGNATLYIEGKLNVVNTGYIKLLEGASLKLYVGGEATISGSGLVNETGKAANFTYIGLTTNTKLVYSGSSAFVGTINAPQADFVLSGTGGAFGAAIVKTYTSSGGSGFHYDECLGAASNFLTITGWREL